METNMLSIIIPSRNEIYLNRTIRDILKKATGEIEILPVLDGYDDVEYKPIIDKRVKYIKLPNPNDRYEKRKRQAINIGVSISRGKYICWMDAHCAMAPGFDKVLANDCKDNWVLVPTRYKCNLESWEGEPWTSKWQNFPTIDYVYWMWTFLKHGSLRTWRWHSKSDERKNVMIDDIFTTGGGFIFMTRKWFNKMGFMRPEDYTGKSMEGEEICLTTILNDGRAVIDKNTWYAHVERKQMPGRRKENRQESGDLAYNYWVNEHKDFFIDLINKNMPIPNYPTNWVEQLYGNT